MSVRISYTAIDHTRKVTVRVELSSPGTRHQNIFTVRAVKNDPASRLALRVTGRTPDGDEFVTYPRSMGLKALLLVNSLVEWLESPDKFAKRASKF